MDYHQRLHLAKLAYDARNEARRYIVRWYGGGEHQEYKGEVGLAKLAKLLRITPHSLKCYLSKGKGHHQFRGVNPTLQIDDIGVIARIDPPAKQKRPRGRPRKVIDAERMGAEFTQQPSNRAAMRSRSRSNKIPVSREDGTLLAPPAKTVPKTRNRRTDEKR